MAAPGGSAMRTPYSGGGNQSVDSGLSGHVGSVAPAGPSAAMLEDHSSEGNSHRVSQVSVALSGEVRNAASAAFSSRSIEGESALSHNVEACSHSQVDGGLLQRRVGSLEENMSVRSNDVRVEPIAGPSRPAMASQQGQSFLRDALHEIVRGLENGGSGNYQATRRAQFSVPSNMGVEHSSRGGGVSISQAVQGQNFQPGIDWEVEMPQNNFGDHLSPGPAGSSGNREQASGPLQVPCLALVSSTQRLPCGSGEPGGRLDNQASVSVSQRVLAESLSAPVPRLVMGDPATSAADNHDQQTLRQSLQAVMRRAFNHVRGSEPVPASVSRNTAEAPSNFPLPYPPIPAQGVDNFVGENNAHSGAANQGWHAALRRESLTAYSGGGMVGSAHGAAVADDVVSDADTNLSFWHRREQEQEHYHQGAVGSVPISGRLESDRSVAQNHHPAATVHTVVGSVEASQGAEQENPPGNNSTVDRQGSFQSGNTSTVNMSGQEDKKNKKKVENEIDDTAHSEKTSGRSSSESPKSVTGLRQGEMQVSSARSPEKRRADETLSTPPEGDGTAKVLNHNEKMALSTQSQSIENPTPPNSQVEKNTGNGMNECSMRSRSRTYQSKKRKHSSDNSGGAQKSKW